MLRISRYSMRRDMLPLSLSFTASDETNGDRLPCYLQVG
ncbi:Uncharacterized protein APZ42_029569 [Daphnia magna]|uniref:Uncharacterized protein n=1 Tax=Daphnia magna TaxID=35525 RepID=A0A164PPU3_9CRUS|nr:Uncharacterized protein APZ42_029569 [Daphnia magna]